MSEDNSRLWGGNTMVGILILVLVVFLLWALVDGRPLFRSSGGDIESTLQETGDSLKSTGRDVADSIRRTVQ